jgi:hypothetical protein
MVFLPLYFRRHFQGHLNLWPESEDLKLCLVVYSAVILKSCCQMKYLFLLFGLGFSQFLFSQLTIYSEPGQNGASATCAVTTIYKGNEIPGGLNKQVSSIHLLKDHIATLAENEDGTGDNYTFVAAVSDIQVDLSRFLNNKISFIRVLPFRQTKKKGVGNQNNAWIDQINVDWFYDWGALDVSLPGREYAMNAWGRQAASNPANIANYIAKPDVTQLLSFNEPDNNEQSNIPVGEAIPLHKNLSQTGLRIGSPAPTESQAFVWLRNFMAGTRAENIKVDHIVIHWYDWSSYLSTGNTAPTPASVFNRFTEYVNRVYSIYGKPIWIKEFNANRNTTSATHEGFIALALPWLEQQPFIERYAYFFPPALPPVDVNGNITPIGIAYRDFNASTLAITKNIDNTEFFADHVGKRFEAEKDALRFGSNIVNCATASEGQMASAVVGGNNRIAFHDIVIPDAGTYIMEVSYFSITARNLTLRINHAPAQVVAIPASGPNWCFQGGSPGIYVIPVNLLAGTNTIEFTESPIIDYIEIKKDESLPVSWLDFNGLVRNKAIELVWRTAQEINSKYFEVLKSKDGVQFETIGKVEAAGNSNRVNTYQFLDNTPAQGNNYYKLKQVDIDGSFTFSKNIMMQYGTVSQELRLVSTTDQNIMVSVFSQQNKQATVLLSGLDGKVLHQRNVVLHQGTNYIQIPASISRGTLGIVALRTDEHVSSLKIMR